MWQDPIVAETRALREEYASQFGHDADAIFQDILHRQDVPGKKLVTFPARKPIVKQVPAQQGAPAD
jgi:hypothetical protein